MHAMRPCLSSLFPSSPLLSPHHFLSPFPSPFSSLSSLRTRRSQAFQPLSSLREMKKATLHKASNDPQNRKFDDRKRRDDCSASENKEGEFKGMLLAGFLLGGVIGGFGRLRRGAR